MDSDSAAMTGSSDAANTPIASSAAVDAVLEYIVAVLQALLGASEGDVRRSLNRQSVTTGGSVHAIGVSATTTDDAYTRSNAHNQELARFITDPALQCVYVNKVRATQTIRAGNAIDDTVKSTTFSPIDTLPAQTTLPRPAYTLTTTLTWHPNNIASVAIIKRSAILDPLSRPLSDQLHVVNLFGPAVSIDTPSITPSNHPSEQTPTTTSANPYESLHSIVHLAVQPYFDAYVSRRSAAVLLTSDATDAQPSDVPSSDAIVLSGTNDITSTNTHEENANTAIPVAKKKIAELELSLLHLQQNVEIPEIVLAVHPAIVRAVGRSKSLNAPKPLPEHVEPPSLLADSTFLNKLQAEVNGWIKEVQTITKLSRDVTSGTASQEINFWLSMEKSLEAIEGQLRSDPVLLALDVLKHAKRFHATVSFLADTGLREATDQVYRYNMLMKDFPLNDLLSATDLERMHDALLAVFNHINKKLKVSPYPIRRALPLAELISRDLAEGILRIMRAQKLMYASYMQFDNVTSTAVQIFVAWEDLIKEFTNVAREVTRKRAEKFLPIKIAAYHVKEGLQARIEYLRTFRKHHEQLVAMVSPTKGVGVFGNAQSGTITAGSAATRPNDLMLGGLDMEEEVRSAYEQVKNVDVLDTSPEGTQIWVNAENA
ncbi:dynein heavy chain [Cystobasidiomycetes sp. EMM_F5]